MEGYINFKKPQNEMFKKLDGKIQKLVAAHSNLNKLYALNDFPSVGVGPKRPFELPPQLPPPPPWIPKVGNTADLNSSNSQWNDEDNNRKPPIMESNQPTSQPNTAHPQVQQRIQSNTNLSPEDKRKFQENLIELLKEQIATVAKTNKFKFTTPPKPKNNNEQRSLLLKSSPQTLFNTIRRETSLLLNKRVQQIHQNHQQQQLSGRSGLSLLSQQQTYNRQCPPQEKYTLNIRPLQQPHQQRQQQLIQKQQNQNQRQHYNLQQQHHQQQQHRPINKLHHTIKVVVPPTEFHHNNNEKLQDIKESDRNQLIQPTKYSSIMLKHGTSPPLTYQVIKNKMKLFQENNQIYFCKSPKSHYGIGLSNINRKKSSQKSIDNVINKLRAKCSPSPTNLEVNIGPTTMDVVDNVKQKVSNFQQQIIYSTTNLLQTSRNLSTTSTPTPIPVFRTPLTTNSSKGSYFNANSKIVKMKSKKSKRIHLFGLKLSNYLEKETPQPTNEKITIEQFAKCLNLVRTNDASLQIRKDQLSQSESKYRLPISNRPIRLRRLRGERLYMPASSSYKATRKAGLQ